MDTINLTKVKKANRFTRLTLVYTLLIIITASACSSPEENKQEKTEQNISAENLTKTTIPIEGMTCNACVANIKKGLKDIDGLEKVEVSLQDRNATVFYEEGAVTPRQIQNAIDRIGYKAGEPVTETN